MNVVIQCRLSSRYPGTVYGRMLAEDTKDELMVSATLDYCIEAAKQRGYTIVNAQEVLEWLRYNANFVGN